MIDQLLELTRPMYLLDCETTGLDPTVDRIIEVAFTAFYPPVDNKPPREWRTLVNPGVDVPALSTAVHGITLTKLLSCAACGCVPDDVAPDRCRCETPKRWPRFSEIAPNLAQGFSNCDYAGKNVRFDLRMIASEMARAGVAWTYLDARIVDADRLEALGEPRTLSDLYRKHLGCEPVDAHEALADVRMTGEVIAAQLRKYNLPRDLDALHELQFPGQIDPDGKFRFDESGEPRFSNWGKHRMKRMREADTGYWDFILKGDFSADVKAVARAAKLGIFPERKQR